MDGLKGNTVASRRIAALCPLLWIGALLHGCNLFTDLDDFHEEAATLGDAGGASGSGSKPNDAGTSKGSVPGCESPETLCLRLKDFTPHLDQLVGVDLVSGKDVLRARALLDPFSTDGNATEDIVLPGAIDKTEVPAAGNDSMLQLEIFGDADEDGEYSPDGADHDWKVPLPASAHLVFPHNSNFVPLTPRPRSIGGDFHLRFSGMGVHKGKMLEVMVIEELTGRTVGLYRMKSIPGDAFEITIPGIIDLGGVVYRVEFFADANGNFRYDDPPNDHTWLRFVESNDKDANLSFEHGTDFKPLEFQRAFHL
jgi:hypothetical protein